MSKEENEIYSKLWVIVEQKLSNSIKYDVWKYLVEIYNEIKIDNPSMKCLLLQMVIDLLSASVYDFHNNNEYEKICMKLINDRNKYFEEQENIELKIMNKTMK